LPSKTNDSIVTIKWSSIDAGGSGYESAELYMAKDDGEYSAICTQNSDSVQISVELNHTYSFFALAKDNVGNLEMNRPIPVSIRVTSGVKPNADQIDFWLRDVYPNPAIGLVYFDYSLSRNGLISLTIIDGLGKTISALVNGYQHEGIYHKNIDCSTYSNGTYYVRLEQGNLVRTRKFVINH
ncbi:MAG TPA: T9SS type A sorting domain-containing protein, partial [Candidatus Kapabacteria bacterium]|nr:T9SS type A sorting domain-containing protein [Candidatus Kapabacteria bacterium]